MTKPNKPPDLPDLPKHPTEALSDNITIIFKNLDKTGQIILGSWWSPITSSIQDAVGIFILLWIPPQIFSLLAGDEFRFIRRCIEDISMLSEQNGISSSYLACIAIVTSNCICWILYLAKVVRFIIHQIQNPDSHI